jgi:hypothetical protein
LPFQNKYSIQDHYPLDSFLCFVDHLIKKIVKIILFDPVLIYRFQSLSLLSLIPLYPVRYSLTTTLLRFLIRKKKTYKRFRWGWLIPALLYSCQFNSFDNLVFRLVKSLSSSAWPSIPLIRLFPEQLSLHCTPSSLA